MRAFCGIIKMVFKSSIQYRMTFAVSVLTQILVMFINIALFKGIYAYNATSTVKGYNLSQMVWYFNASSIVFCFIWNNTMLAISRKILSGDLTIDLLRPISLIKFYTAQAIGSRFVAVFAEFIPGMILYSLILPPRFLTPLSMLEFFVLIIPSFLMNYMVAFLLAMTAIKIKNSISINGIKVVLTTLLGGTSIPLEFYPGWINQILDFLPFKYMIYWPIQFFLNKQPTNDPFFIFRILAIQIFWLAIFYLVYRVCWKGLIKRFCAAGG